MVILRQTYRLNFKGDDEAEKGLRKLNLAKIK